MLAPRDEQAYPDDLGSGDGRKPRRFGLRVSGL